VLKNYAIDSGREWRQGEAFSPKRHMATLGRTLLRFTGAVLFGASATSIDNPGLLFAPTSGQPSTTSVVASGREIRLRGNEATDSIVLVR